MITNQVLISVMYKSFYTSIRIRPILLEKKWMREYEHTVLRNGNSNDSYTDIQILT